MKQEEGCQNRSQIENAPFQRTFLRRNHVEMMPKPAKNLQPPSPHPHLQKHRNKDWRGLLLSLSALKLTRVGGEQFGQGCRRCEGCRSFQKQAPASIRLAPALYTLPLPCPWGALLLWFLSLSQCGWLQVGIMSQHGVQKQQGFKFSWVWWLTAAKMSQWEMS